MKKIAIGDVHGCLTELEKMIKYLKENNIYNPDEDMLIFLGDYVDRGENPSGVIKFIRDLQSENPEKVIALMGNHEDMLIDYIDMYDRTWLFNGYGKTIDSYCH